MDGDDLRDNVMRMAKAIQSPTVLLSGNRAELQFGALARYIYIYNKKKENQQKAVAVSLDSGHKWDVSKLCAAIFQSLETNFELF